MDERERKKVTSHNLENTYMQMLHRTEEILLRGLFNYETLLMIMR